MQATLDYLLIISRLEKNGKARKVMETSWHNWDGGLDKFPWKKKDNEYVTPFIDLIELYEFVDKE
jgi:hypothetical protein